MNDVMRWEKMKKKVYQITKAVLVVVVVGMMGVAKLNRKDWFDDHNQHIKKLIQAKGLT